MTTVLTFFWVARSIADGQLMTSTCAGRNLGNRWVLSDQWNVDSDSAVRHYDKGDKNYDVYDKKLSYCRETAHQLRVFVDWQFTVYCRFCTTELW